jgi:hypothetical protein
LLDTSIAEGGRGRAGDQLMTSRNRSINSLFLFTNSEQVLVEAAVMLYSATRVRKLCKSGLAFGQYQAEPEQTV